MRIPFEFHSNLILVPLQINGSDTLKFIFDTGVSTTLVTDPKIAQNHGIVGYRKVKIAGVGDGDYLSATVSLNNRLSMGEMSTQQQHIIVLDEDLLNISEFVGVPVHGIIGYEVFSRFVVTIDFQNLWIVLEEPDHYRYRRSKGRKFPIEIEHTKPYFREAYLQADNGQEVPVNVLLDTGAGHAISLDLNTDARLQLPQKTINAQLGRGLSGNISGRLGRSAQLRIGDFVMKNVIVSYPDSSSVGLKIQRPSEFLRQGNIGCEVFRRFKVTFNYNEGYVVMKPIKNKIKETFEHNMAGIELVAKGGTLNEIYIDRVAADSPAALAGIMDGDQLLLLNNKKFTNLTLTDIYKLFQKGEGKEVTLLLKRRDYIYATTFQLRRVI